MGNLGLGGAGEAFFFYRELKRHYSIKVSDSEAEEREEEYLKLLFWVRLHRTDD